MEETLKRIYYDPEKGFCGADKLLKRAREEDQTIRMKDVKLFLKDQELNQVFQKSRELLSYPIYSATEDAFQCDLIFLKPKDQGYVGCLTLININTRKAFVYPIKGKSAQEMTELFSKFLDNVKCFSITSDNGHEFVNHKVHQLFNKNSIIHHVNIAGDHRTMGIIERFNRTIKQLISRYQYHNNTESWLNVIPAIVRNYNTRIHSSIGQSPASVTRKQEQELIWKAIQRTVVIKRQEHLRIGDFVRVLLDKEMFKKEGTHWSKEIGEIEGVR